MWRFAISPKQVPQEHISLECCFRWLVNLLILLAQLSWSTEQQVICLGNTMGEHIRAIDLWKLPSRTSDRSFRTILLFSSWLLQPLKKYSIDASLPQTGLKINICWEVSIMKSPSKGGWIRSVQSVDDWDPDHTNYIYIYHTSSVRSLICHIAPYAIWYPMYKVGIHTGHRQTTRWSSKPETVSSACNCFKSSKDLPRHMIYMYINI